MVVKKMNTHCAQNTQIAESRQRRNFFRLPCQIPTKFRLLNKNENGQLISTGWYNCTIRDLSGGGVSLATKQDMNENDFVFISLRLDDENMFVVGEIRKKNNRPSDSHDYVYGIMFDDLSSGSQDKIVRFLIRHQKRRTTLAS